LRATQPCSTRQTPVALDDRWLPVLRDLARGGSGEMSDPTDAALAVGRPDCRVTVLTP
jgi:hypothetical protein